MVQTETLLGRDPQCKEINEKSSHQRVTQEYYSWIFLQCGLAQEWALLHFSLEGTAVVL